MNETGLGMVGYPKGVIWDEKMLKYHVFNEIEVNFRESSLNIGKFQGSRNKSR